MGQSLLMWRFFTFIVATDCVIDLCHQKPLNVRHATYKALTYKIGTLINCNCKKGFRRVSTRPFLNCTGNSGHTAWKNQCKCQGPELPKTQKQTTPNPEEQKERKPTEMQSQVQPTDQINLPGHCGEPPLWEHEDPKRTYHFVMGQTIHYECDQGFRALQRGAAKSICKMICGEVRWTQPQLRCIREGDEEYQASTDTPSENETSCPLITTGTTTDFQRHTKEDTTMEMFVFTTKYQIAAAGCILLLIIILLLSTFSWQWRRRKSRRTI